MKTDLFAPEVRHLSAMSRQRICTGNGDCLEQNCDPSINSVYVKYRDMTCEHNCEPVKCPNFAVCGEALPRWVLGCHGGRCWRCNDRFGKNLTFPDEPVECPVCMEVKLSVIQPNCTHMMCLDCFKRMQIDGPPRTGQPAFPYPDREDEYFDYFDISGGQHPLYYDPLVLKFNADCERWEEEWCEKWRAEENLRKCPLCRS